MFLMEKGDWKSPNMVLASKIKDLESFQGLDRKKYVDISKYSLGEQNNGSGGLSKVLIKKSQKLAKLPKYWARSQFFGKTPKILGNFPKIAKIQNIGQFPKISGLLLKIAQTPKILAKVQKVPK